MRRIDLALDEGEVSVNDVRSLSGVLCWAAKVIPYGMVYVRELYAVVADLGLSSCTKAMARTVFFVDAELIGRIRLDIGWWLNLCQDYRLVSGALLGRRISQVGVQAATPTDLTLEICADMSGDGLGGYWRGTSMWCHSSIPSTITLDKNQRFGKRLVSSAYAEAAGILMCLLTFLPVWAAKYPHRSPGAVVLVHTDSVDVVEIWNNQRGRDKLRPYLRALERLCACYNIELRLRHIPGHENRIADMISRLQDGRMNPQLRDLFPEADETPQAAISHGLLFL